MVGLGWVVHGTLDEPTVSVESDIRNSILPEFEMLVGHNIKFDLHWLRRSGARVVFFDKDDTEIRYLGVWEFIVKRATIWDTALAEYLCTGQRMNFPSLEDCCKRRGITLRKTIDIGEALKEHAGDTSKVPDLDVYLKNDVEMTSELFQKQMEDPYVMDNLEWFLSQMEATLAEAEIEWNGTGVDVELLSAKIDTGYKVLKANATAFHTLVHDLHGKDVADTLSMTSATDLATLLYGGEYSWERREEIGKYKTGAKMGQPRFKVHKLSKTLTPVAHVTYKTDGGSPSTADHALEYIMKSRLSTSPAYQIAKVVRESREYEKAIGTTLTGILKWSAVDDKSCVTVVRPQINNTMAITGRRSSSKPNGQNWPTNDPLHSKQVLVPKKNGRVIVSVDFKQAEIMALAYVANDEALQRDIIEGVDIHSKMGELAYKTKPTKEQRRVVKTVVFGSIYGGKADTLAVQAGVPTTVVEAILKAFAALYTQSWSYLQKIPGAMQLILSMSPQYTGEVEQTSIGAQRVPHIEVPSLTGRRYTFKGYWSEYHKQWKVSSTQPKNYFIQGFATGDLVPICYGRIWRFVKTNWDSKVELIGTIHDSLVFEVDEEWVDKFVKEVVFLINGAGEYLAEICRFSRPWTMPVNCDVEVGNNLGDLKAYSIT